MLDEGKASWQLQDQANEADVQQQPRHQGKTKDRLEQQQRSQQLNYQLAESRDSNHLRQRLIAVERKDAFESASISMKKLLK